MRLIPFLEITGYQEEGERDYPNPLPSISSDDPRFENWFDRYDEVISSNFHREPNSPQEYVDEVDGVWKRYGKSINVPIDQIVASEALLSKSSLAGDYNDPPRIIKIDDILFIIDGNHRVVRAHQSGNSTVQAIVLDVDAMERGKV